MEYAPLVRRLLRSVRRPHRLERDAFGVALKRAAGTASVRAALRRAIEQAFHGGNGYATYRTMLLRYDLEDPVPRSRAAAEMGLSSRRFYYLHAEAVDILAREVARMMRANDARRTSEHLADLLLESDPARAAAILGDGKGARDALGALKLLYACVVTAPQRSAAMPPGAPAFHGTEAAVAAGLRALWFEQHGRRQEALEELRAAHQARCDHLGNPSPFAVAVIARVRGLIALHDADARGLDDAARAVRSPAAAMPRGFEAWPALLAIEAALAQGEPEHARELIDAALPDAVNSGAYRTACLLALCEARVHFLSGDFEAALHAANAVASSAGSHADIASAAFLLHARAALALRLRISQASPPSHSLWDELYAGALHARAAFDAGDDERSRTQAEAFASEALRFGYRGIAAHAAATVALSQSDVLRAIEAWRLWLDGRDLMQGFDLFATARASELLARPEVHGAVHELACRECAAWPLLHFVTGGVEAQAFWSTLLSAALEGVPPKSYAPFANALFVASPYTAHAPPGVPAAATSAPVKPFAVAVSYLLPLEQRSAFRRALCALLGYCNARARRAIERERARAALELTT